MAAKRKSRKKRDDSKHVSTKIVGGDVLTDVLDVEKPRFVVDYEHYLSLLWQSNDGIYNVLKNAESLEEARSGLYEYLEKAERSIFQTDNDLHILEKATVRECIRVFRSIIGPINELRTEVSALDCLWKLAKGRKEELRWKVAEGFLMEFINLFRGVGGNSNIYRESETVKKEVPDFLQLEGQEAADARTDILDDMGATVNKYFRKFPSGLDEEVITWRKENKERILKYFKGSEREWKNWKWQAGNVVKTPEPLISLVELTDEQKAAIRKASANRLPFGITPYYLSLMDKNLSIGYDHAIRAQVIPPPDYVDQMLRNRENRSMVFDFMGEHDTSPVDLITRRYPLIAILKPFNTCAQICVYCQRNWEIDECMAPRAMASREELKKALKWFDDHQAVGDVLITGGDPMMMADNKILEIIEELSGKKQIYRIRIGTRTPVVLPFRLTDSLIDEIARFNVPGKREIAFVTHFEHSYEITPEARAAVGRILARQMSVYNQQVFTLENSRRFETAKLRKDLRLIGVDPYYTFNMKGKQETRRYMVPIARILQERKEEARLLPGLDRSDEPVFNVPKLGKNHLRAWQDHRLVMIRPDGSRVYEFHPWEKNISPMPPYNYVDVPIYDYLEELAARGENVRDYRTIWFYY